MKKLKTIRQFLYIAGCSAAIALLAAGCVPHNESQPEQSVQVSTAGSETVYEQGTTQQAIVQVPVDEKEPAADTMLPNDNPYGIDPAKPMVALTFDDGPSKYTWDIVHSLQSHKARATFFIIGNQVATHQAAIDYTLANHNEIASHSFGHQNLTKLSDVEVLNQIRPVDTALLEQHEYIPVLYRVPYGSRDERVLEILKQEGKPVIGWSVDPYDWKVKDKETIVNHVLNSVQDGDIILLHDIYEPTAQAVAELVPALQERGYQIVTVSEMFQFRGITPEPGVYYRELPPVKETE